MAQRGLLLRVVVVVASLGSLLAWPLPSQALAFTFRHQSDLLPGVKVQGLVGSGLSVDVGRVARGAPVRVEVIASGAVASGVETTSDVCRRTGAILCVNADFSACNTCTSAFGGIIHDRTLQRSPVSNHPQLWLGPAGPGAGPLGWGATVEATLTYLIPSPPILGGLLPPPPPTQRVETVSLPLDVVNRERSPNQVALYTPSWAATTRTPNGGDEAVLTGGQPIVGADVALTLGSWKGAAGNNAIPGNGMVLSADGAGTARLRAFWNKANDPAAARRSVTLRTTADRAVEESVGGHPVVLANGQTLISASRDPFAVNRHPRTLVGWNPAGELLLVTIDGRDGHSQGASLVEAVEVLRNVGATSGFNLDGGGSTTFVSLPPDGRVPQVLNRPSDGNERRVTTIIAVVPLDAAAVRAPAAPPPPPPPPPAPPGPPPVDEASTAGLPAPPATTPAPTTTTTTSPPTTVAPTTTLPPPPETTTTAAPVVVELAAPLMPQTEPPPPPPVQPSTVAAGSIATVALVVAGGASARSVRRARRLRRAARASAGPPE